MLMVSSTFKTPLVCEGWSPRASYVLIKSSRVCPSFPCVVYDLRLMAAPPSTCNLVIGSPTMKPFTYNGFMCRCFSPSSFSNTASGAAAPSGRLPPHHLHLPSKHTLQVWPRNRETNGVIWKDRLEWWRLRHCMNLSQERKSSWLAQISETK